jgi:tRNA(fMet)-specific endonuclease VapC
MRYLLDTNSVSDLVRDPQGRVADRTRGVGEAQVCTSIIVAAELHHGALWRRKEELIRARLERSGRPIGGNDL